MKKYLKNILFLKQDLHYVFNCLNMPLTLIFLTHLFTLTSSVCSALKCKLVFLNQT